MKRFLTLLLAIVLCSSCMIVNGLADLGTLILPSSPIYVSDISDYGTLYGKIVVNSISYELNTYTFSSTISFKITFSGTVTELNKGYTPAIRWNIYDKDGYVVDTGLAYASNVGVGEKFKESRTTISFPYGTYTLKITNAGQGSSSTPPPTATPTPKPTVTPTPAAKPEYKLSDVSYNGKVITGKLLHTDGTGFAQKLRVKVTFYIVGNYYMSTNGIIEEDGSFEVVGVGPIQYITVVAFDSKADGGTDRLDATELFVTE